MDLTEALAEAVIQVKARTRYPLMENILEAIDDSEIEVALLDALDEINSYAPQTQFKFVDVWTQEDTRWKRMLLLGANKNSILTLLNDWTQRGFDVNIANGEISQDDRREKINELYSTLQEQFDNVLQRLKETSQKVSRGFKSPNNDIMGLRTPIMSRRWGRPL